MCEKLSMAVTQTSIVINEGLTERQRTTGAGTKSRYTIEVKSEPILHELNEEQLGKGPAEAIAEAIRNGIKSITEFAKPTTLRQRDAAKRALERGAAWAKRRYAGGRTGQKAPSGSVRLFNDSGRLADGVVAQQNVSEGAWTINVTANRLDPSTFKSREDFVSMVDRLRSMVPAMRDPTAVPAVREAIADGIRNLLIRELKRTDDLLVARARAVLGLLGL